MLASEADTEQARSMSNSKIAVIGSGIAGLSAAWLLSKKYQVTLFERQPQPGMGAYAVNVGSQETPVTVDIPLRIITSGYYNELFNLYKTVGVEIERTDHAGAFYSDQGEQIFHYRNFHFGKHTLSTLSGPNALSKTNISRALEAKLFLKKIRKQDLRKLENVTLGDFLNRNGHLDSVFVQSVLLPMLSTICTCDYDSVLNYPAEIILDYLTCGVAKEGVWKARHGVSDIVNRLTQGYEVVTHAQAMRLEKSNDQISLFYKDNASSQQSTELKQQTFDHLVIATQPQQAAELLKSESSEDLPSNAQKQRLYDHLAAIRFAKSTMVVHRDTGIYPIKWQQLSPVCYSIDPALQRPMATVCLNKSMPSVRDCEEVFQTWHPTVEIDPDKILASAEFERPLISFEMLNHVKAIKASMAQANNRIWFCGSYLGGGIPLLEAGVKSALEVANRLNIETPW